MTAAVLSTRNMPELPPRTRIAIFVRLLAIQGSWNYETLLGNGIGFCIEPWEDTADACSVHGAVLETGKITDAIRPLWRVARADR